MPRELRDVSDHASGGGKHPEVMIISAGLNGDGDPQDYVRAFHACPWRWPGLATLVLTPDGSERAIVARIEWGGRLSVTGA